jgi:hypothetical protein
MDGWMDKLLMGPLTQTFLVRNVSEYAMTHGILVSASLSLYKQKGLPRNHHPFTSTNSNFLPILKIWMSNGFQTGGSRWKRSPTMNWNPFSLARPPILRQTRKTYGLIDNIILDPIRALCSI